MSGGDWSARLEDKFGIDMDMDNQFVVVVTEAECAQAEWVGRTAMRLASQVSAMEVEQMVVPAIETRGGSSSKAVSVALLAWKVSSDAFSLSNWANGCPEDLGTG